MKKTIQVGVCNFRTATAAQVAIANHDKLAAEVNAAGLDVEERKVALLAHFGKAAK